MFGVVGIPVTRLGATAQVCGVGGVCIIYYIICVCVILYVVCIYMCVYVCVWCRGRYPCHTAGGDGAGGLVGGWL